MNDQFSQLDPSPDRAGLSLSSRAKNMVRSTTSLIKGGPVQDSTADLPLTKSTAAVQVSEQAVPGSDSTNLFKLSIALNTVGVVVGLIALLRRERSRSLVVLPDEELDIVRAVPPIIESPSVLTPTVESLFSKEVIAEQQSIAVPVSHDEVFVERRPMNDSVATSLTPIVGDEEMQIALSEDQLDVHKQIVVTDEVTITKAEEQGTERISNTVHYDEPRL